MSRWKIGTKLKVTIKPVSLIIIVHERGKKWCQLPSITLFHHGIVSAEGQVDAAQEPLEKKGFCLSIDLGDMEKEKGKE